jgi:hypothetical protein
MIKVGLLLITLIFGCQQHLYFSMRFQLLHLTLSKNLTSPRESLRTQGDQPHSLSPARVRLSSPLMSKPQANPKIKNKDLEYQHFRNGSSLPYAPLFFNSI